MEYGRPSIKYGLIPESEYLRKIQQTNIDEDPQAYENFLRKELVDFTPDKNHAIEAYEPRSSDDRGSGYQSASRLNLLHSGMRSTELPYLPDGTFLDHEFTVRDPRGVQNQPNMRETVKHSVARAPFIKFYNDSDYSVPESGINPVEMQKIRNAGFHHFKENFKNFDESKDSWHNGGTHKKLRNGSDAGLVDRDGVIKDLTDASVRNRTDAVSALSNDPTIAFRHSTPDHRVKIARYGVVKSGQSRSSQNWTNTLRSTFLDHNTPVPINGIMANKMLANLIIDLEGQRQTRQEVAQGADYNESYSSQVRSKKLVPDDIIKILLIQGSQPIAPHEKYEGKMLQRYINTKMPNNREALENVHINHQILNSMEQVNKRPNKKKMDDLRDNIEESAVHQGIFRTSSNSKLRSKHSKKANSDIIREGLDNRTIEESRTITNYGGVKPLSINKIMDNLEWEKFGEQSLLNKQRSKGGKFRSNNPDNLEQDQDQIHGYNDFGFIDHAPINSVNGGQRNQQRNMDFGDMDRGETYGAQDMKKMYTDMIIRSN
jgi:hypothetical protein